MKTASMQAASDAALAERIERYAMNPVHAEALREACEQLQASRRFCPRYHGVFNCFPYGRQCPRHGCEWTCWFDGLIANASEKQSE